MVSKQILEKCYELGHIHKGRVFYIYIYGIYVYAIAYRYILTYTTEAVNDISNHMMQSTSQFKSIEMIMNRYAPIWMRALNS